MKPLKENWLVILLSAALSLMISMITLSMTSKINDNVKIKQDIELRAKIIDVNKADEDLKFQIEKKADKESLNDIKETLRTLNQTSLDQNKMIIDIWKTVKR